MEKETQAMRKASETRTTMKRTILTALVLAVVLVLTQGNGVAHAASAAGIDADVDAALMKLYEEQPVAKVLAEKAAAILVFPNMVKAGFVVGAQYGEGSLRKKGRTVGYYNSVAASYGMQAGAQTFGYVLFLMTNSAVNYLNRSGGWEIGVGPSTVVVDEGIARTLTSTTLKSDVYAFIFDQKGLMAGTGIQGSKITKIKK
jgi:lipid-binding SYLF domain-containing protein